MILISVENSLDKSKQTADKYGLILPVVLEISKEPVSTILKCLFTSLQRLDGLLEANDDVLFHFDKDEVANDVEKLIMLILLCRSTKLDTILNVPMQVGDGSVLTSVIEGRKLV